MSAGNNKDLSLLPPEMIRSFLEASQDCICLFRTDGTLDYCNKAHKEILGYDPGELEGLHFSKFPFIPKDQVSSIRKLFKKLEAGEQPGLVQVSANRKDGNRIWLEAAASALYKDGKLFAIQLVCREITGRKHAEEQLKQHTRNVNAIFDGIADPVILHRLNLGEGPDQIIMCNDKITEVTGYSREEILKMTIADLGHPDSGLQDTEMSKKLFKGKPVLFERLIVRKDKTVFPVEVHAQLIDYEGEKMVLSLLRNITERKKVEEETHLHLMFEKIVSNISSRFINMPDHMIDKGIERTLKEVGEFIGAIRGGIFLLSDDNKNLSISHEWCSDPVLSQKSLIQNLPMKGFFFNPVRRQDPDDVVLDSIEDLPPRAIIERKWFAEHGFNPSYYVPIISEDKLVGALGFIAEDHRNHRWPRQYGYLLRYIATIFYNALNRKEISRNLRLAQFTLDHYSGAVFWFSFQDYRVIDVNPQACRSLGYKREELLGKTVYDFDQDFKDEDGKIQEALKKHKSLNFESIHRNKKGKEFPVEITANYIEFEGNDYVVAVAHDISERKEAEELLLKSEQEYHKIFDNVADIFYEASLDGKLLNITPSMERITRYRRKDLIGKPMESFYYDPADRTPLLKELFKKGEIQDYELNIKDIDGTSIPCSLNTRVIYHKDGKPDRIVGSLTDIRHRKRAEKQIRQLSTALHQSPVSVIITDPVTKILYVNDSFIQFSGMEPEQIIGTTPSEITQGQISLDKYKDLWERIKKGMIWKGELEYTKRDGSQVWLSVTVSPVLDDQNRPINLVGILEEITERKIAEQNLRKAKEDAERSDHLKSAFLANMSHEIRTPMNAILGFSALLKDETLDDEQRHYYIDIINSKGRDLLRIISDIIDISRIEAGDLYIKMELVEIYPFIRNVFNEFKEDTQVKSRSNLQFRLNLPHPERNVNVNTDPARLKQVFVNLIQNALKFTQDGFVEVGFELSDDDNIRFYVRDTGIGIDEDKKGIIFERFRQIDDSHTREYGGTGLGLAICKNLLELMGTELSLFSKEGQGSEFSFEFKYILSRTPSTTPEIDESKLESLELDLKGKKILIAEDDGSSYLFLETLLNKFSPEIIWAKSGKQAVDIVNRTKGINMILMDIRMPEMDGIEATKKILKKYPDMPIIAQTAYAQVTDRKLALENGCSDYLSKPISATDLTALLIKYLSQKK